MNALEQNRFQRIARAMSKNFDIEVVSEGLRFETDGKRISFPANSDYLKDADKRVLHGLLDHETLHIIEEQEARRASVRTPIDILNGFKTNKEKFIFNVLEDYRIEAKYSKQYIGVCENLRSTIEHFVKHYKDNGIPDCGWWKKFGFAISGKLNGFDIDELKEYEPLLELIDEEIINMSSVSKAEDVENITKSIISKIKHVDDESDKNNENVGLKVLVEKMNGEEDSDVETDIFDAVKKHIEKVARNDSKENKRYIPDPKILKMDKWEKAEIDNGSSSIERYNSDKKKILAQISAMRARFLSLIWSEQVPTVTTGHTSGAIDKKRAAKIITGSTNVYKKVVNGVEIDTAICILVDLSGSMGCSTWGDNKSYYAKLTCMALVETFEMLNIPNALYGFYNTVCYKFKCSPGTVRDEPFVYKIFKEFNESYKRVKTRLHGISGYQNNVDGEAVMASALRLNSRPESRKILIVVSDGMPNGGNISTNMLERHLRDTVKTITNSGIEVLGIGIQTDSVKEFYNDDTGAKNIVINDLNVMATEVYRGTRSLILNKIRRK